MIEKEQIGVIALGGNLSFDQNPPRITLRNATNELIARGVRVLAESRYFTTPCFPAGAGPDYINAAISFSSELSPAALLQLLHEVEAAYGRAREQRWGMRTLDLDLICYGDRILPDRESYDAWRQLDPARQTKLAPDQLILPHPRLQDRGFVLVPMADVAPEWHHPVLGLTVQEMLAALPARDLAEIRPL
ncbi:2-amino-4-hydroxy-6-hydroxymethyldihydropteridine diphosphokinase [Ruegeria sp. 1NDH52C]|uniref:2-amino-4-hydroxy-6-hydroxymethyldihydropteridine pyrophosphokinase n=1 Tax=Ruegeria alba TaxID=2916756 RepID=A0ABS9NZF7_9RHOB|nr:2-amino-4-hydroxy-6-hydroxymethyldihydropteridine diphosphokinase [Ruegeria alba]MCG6558925.1 2-amino-4-hydroxy-6-hydroxymethyldihydropteridine diphosphokinase [Ruegeria alba]